MTAFLLAWSTGMGGCGDTLQLNLVIFDPCNQQGISSARHMEVEIQGAGIHEGTIWDAASGAGTLEEVPAIDDAIVSITGRASTQSGEPAEALVAASVGIVDLSGAHGEELVELTLIPGRVGGFARTTDTHSPAACSDAAAARQAHTATLLRDGRVFLAGGFRRNSDSNTFWETTELYDPRTQQFGRAAIMQWKRAGHTATLLKDGRILIAGGEGPIDHDGDSATPAHLQALQVALIYDPDSGRFVQTVRMQQQRAYHTATQLEDGRILLAGGTREGAALSTTELFDPAKGTFSAGPALLTRRSFHSAVAVSGSTVALIGGHADGRVLGTIEFVAPSGSQVASAALAVPRSHVAAALIESEDAIVVAGGFDVALADPTEPWMAQGVRSIEVVRLNRTDLAASQVICSSLSLAQGRAAAGVSAVGGGVLVVGGVGSFFDAANPAEGARTLASGELISFTDVDRCIASVEPTSTPMAGSRAGGALTKLKGGDLLVTGGFSRDSMDPDHLTSLSAGEIYVRFR